MYLTCFKGMRFLRYYMFVRDASFVAVWWRRERTLWRYSPKLKLRY